MQSFMAAMMWNYGAGDIKMKYKYCIVQNNLWNTNARHCDDRHFVDNFPAHADLPSLTECYKISRNVGNLIDILFFCNKACFWCESERLLNGENPRGFWCESERVLVWIREGFGENPRGFWWESERVLVGIREGFGGNPRGFWWESERLLVGIREGFGGNPRGFSCESERLLVGIREGFGGNPRGFWWESERCWSRRPEIGAWRCQNDDCVGITFVQTRPFLARKRVPLDAQLPLSGATCDDDDDQSGWWET